MPRISLELSDALELAELLTFIADWLSGTQKQTLADSLTAFVGHTAHNTDDLRADLLRFVFLLALNDGEHLLGQAPS